MMSHEAENAAKTGNMKQLHYTTSRLAGKYSKHEQPVKDKAGATILGKEEQLGRWAEHFEELLNRSVPSNPSNIEPAESNLNINCERPSKHKIKKAILHLKMVKQQDQIPSLLKHSRQMLTPQLSYYYTLFGKIWDEEKVPTDWKRGYLIKLKSFQQSYPGKNKRCRG